MAGLLLVAGCGDGGPARYHVSGKVTYDGKPIPAGSVMFTPDTSQGNSGPAVSIEIRDGEYDSEWADTGHVGGPHRVTITALDGQETDEFTGGLPMFPDYETEIDLPEEDGVQDLNVPAEWQADAPQSGGVIDHGP